MEPTQRAVSFSELTACSVDHTTRAAENSEITDTVLKSAARNVRCELTADELARVGVESLDKHNRVLKCTLCKAVWTAPLTADGSLHPLYWRCTNRCNW